MDSPFFFEKTTYWSHGDEKAHFDWLGRIACVQEARGQGSRLYLKIDDPVSAEDLRELKAIYRRYGADLDQLKNIKPISDEIDDAQD